MVCFFWKQGDFPRKTGRRLSTNRAIAERDQGFRWISPKTNNREKQGGKQGDLSLWKEKRGDVPLLRPNLPAPPAPNRPAQVMPQLPLLAAPQRHSSGGERLDLHSVAKVGQTFD
jgi:hypothetical protein